MSLPSIFDLNEEQFDRLRSKVNPFMRKLCGLELFKAHLDGRWIGVGIRKWQK